MKWALSLLIMGVGLLAAPTASAYGESTARLTITPQLCVFDVVQDGSNQTLQPSPGCEAALPNLLPVPSQAVTVTNSLFALPFAGNPDSPPLIPSQAEAAWLPIVSKEQSGPTTHPASTLTYVASGMAMTAIASAVGIDIALFEMHYSRSMGRWLHRQSFGRFFKG